MVDKKKRIILSGGNRRDIEQIGASLTTTYDILGRSFASSSVFSSGNNGKLTNINLSNVAVEIEPVKNLIFQTGISYRTLESASPTFSLDYYTDIANGVAKSDVKQSEVNFQVEYTPKRKTIGFAVERENVDMDSTDYWIAISNTTNCNCITNNPLS